MSDINICLTLVMLLLSADMMMRQILVCLGFDGAIFSAFICLSVNCELVFIISYFDYVNSLVNLVESVDLHNPTKL